VSSLRSKYNTGGHIGRVSTGPGCLQSCFPPVTRALLQCHQTHIHRPPFVYCPVDGHSGCFRFLVIRSIAAIDTHTRFGVDMSSLWVWFSGWVAGSYGVPCLTLFSIAAASFYISQQGTRGLFLSSLTIIASLWVWSAVPLCFWFAVP
jgi:hypothetical protein